MTCVMRLIRVGLAVIATACGWQAALAQDYPQKPIRVIAAFPVGSLPDTLARTLGQRVGDRLRQQVVIENRLGAGGNIAYEAAAKAAPDGYTLLVGSNSLIVNPSVYRTVPYDPFRDFAPITHIATQAFLLVVQPSFPAGSVQELVAAAKAKPGQLSFGSSGNGTVHHFAAEMFKSATGIRLTHVPYKGAIFAITDLLAGRIDLIFLDIAQMVPLAKSGKVRVLATASAKRENLFPEVPTLAEAGVPGVALEGWYGVFAPAGTPPAIVTRLNQEFNAVVADPELRRWLAGQGPAFTGGTTPEEFGAFVRADFAKMARVVKAADVKVD